MIYDSFTKEEIIERTNQAAMIETYVLTGLGRGIHTDNLKYVGLAEFDNREIDNLPFDEEGKVEVNIEIMGKEDYEKTVLANCSQSWSDYDLADDDKIAVIILNNELYEL